MTEDNAHETILKILNTNLTDKTELEFAIRCETQFKLAREHIKNPDIETFVVGFVCGLKSAADMLR